jgi:hypothetical protein
MAEATAAGTPVPGVTRPGADGCNNPTHASNSLVGVRYRSKSFRAGRESLAAVDDPKLNTLVGPMIAGSINLKALHGF